jgi:general secretion pathway protein K
MKTNREGTALLAVLWLSAALSAIAFTVASTVRGETERTATGLDELRARYLAAGAIDRALLYIEWGSSYRNANGESKYFQAPMPILRFEFPTGSAIVEVIPESAKLNVNAAPPAELGRLLQALGVDVGQAEGIVAGMLDWRSASAGGSFTQFDQHYLSLTPSFRSRHASFQEIEELLLVQGVTPDLFYGRYTRDAEGKLVGRAGLRDCLSVFGTQTALDANTVQPAVMQAIGISPGSAAGIVAYRNSTVIRNVQQISSFLGDGNLTAGLGVAAVSVATLRATARLRLSNGQYSDARRSVEALVKFIGPAVNPPYHVMRWYDSGVFVQ